MPPGRSHLILDLDLTLVQSTMGPPPSAPDPNDRELLVAAVGTAGLTFYWRKRPHLAEFLAFCFSHFDVSVWTVGVRAYATHVIEWIFTEEQQRALKHTLFREDTPPTAVRTIDANGQEKLGYAITKSLSGFRAAVAAGGAPPWTNYFAIDDNTCNYHLDPSTHRLYVSPWTGDQTDTALRGVVRHLDRLRCIFAPRGIHRCARSAARRRRLERASPLLERGAATAEKGRRRPTERSDEESDGNSSSSSSSSDTVDKSEVV